MVKLLKKNVSKSIKLEVKRPSVKKLTTKLSISIRMAEARYRRRLRPSYHPIPRHHLRQEYHYHPSVVRRGYHKEGYITSSSLVERDELVKIKEEDATKEEKMDVLGNKASEMSVSSNEEEGEEEKEKTAPTEAVALVPGVYIDEDQGI